MCIRDRFSPFAPRTSEITNRTTEQKTATMRHDSPWAISVGAVENTGEMASRSSQQTAADVPAIMRISQLSLRLDVYKRQALHRAMAMRRR